MRGGGGHQREPQRDLEEGQRGPGVRGQRGEDHRDGGGHRPEQHPQGDRDIQDNPDYQNGQRAGRRSVINN